MRCGSTLSSDRGHLLCRSSSQELSTPMAMYLSMMACGMMVLLHLNLPVLQMLTYICAKQATVQNRQTIHSILSPNVMYCTDLNSSSAGVTCDTCDEIKISSGPAITCDQQKILLHILTISLLLGGFEVLKHSHIRSLRNRRRN